MLLTSSANILNRLMERADFYPFILTTGVRNKWAFIHALFRETQVLR
ncbi:putative zinc-binding metallopeptidase (plasmid) [Kozakia baliensis]